MNSKPAYRRQAHQIGRTYEKPHFFILSKGLNSGKPLKDPCPNCFVLITQTIANRDALYYLCLALKTGKYFTYYLRGSVIPFISIKEAKAVIEKALQNQEHDQWCQKITKLKKVDALEQNLKKQLQAISQLKLVLLRT